MAVRSILRSIVAMAALAASCVNVAANSVNLSYLEGLTPVAPDAITALGTDLFGDSVNLFNGALSFEHTDLNLPGNSRLPVAVGRSHTPGQPDVVRGQFGDWDLEVPRITGSYSTRVGWVSSFGGGRCSNFNLPPTVSEGTTSFIASDYWSGAYLRVPGAGGQEILRRAPGFTEQPTDNTYPLVTRNNWQLRCLPALLNAPGEGFVAVSPEGVTYHFNWMASRVQTDVKKSGAHLARSDFFLMATRVTDRFNNWVQYTYEPSNPLLLKTIESNDGRVINITNLQGRAVSATDGTRTFSYQYSALGNLSFVNQPDGSKWTFELASMVPPQYQTIGEGSTCDAPGDHPSDVLVGRITHPSGAVGTFTTEFKLLGRSMVTRTCKWVGTPTFTVGAVWPRFFVTQSLTKKQIDGPGMASLVWTYGISSPGSWSTCTTCPTTRTVTVTNPQGSVSRHTFGTRWQVDEGQLLSVEDGWTSTGALRRTDFRYRVHTASERFPDQFGVSLLRNNDWLSSRNRPLDRRIITQQSTQFTWEVGGVGTGFDNFARPEVVRKYSSLGFSRTEQHKRFDHKRSWALGQTESITETVGQRVVEQNVYDTTFGLPVERREFGRLVAKLGYHTDGNLHTITDAANRVTRLDNYRRGRPQLLTFADLNVERQSINNLGLVDTHTNAAGTTTTYEYDLMGRVRTIIYPGGDPVVYHPTVQTFAQSSGGEYGLPAGHWRQTITTGQAVRIRYFDGLWRPRVEVRYDAGDAGNTAVFKEFRYDLAGNKAFESYPARTLEGGVNAWRPGTSYGYDNINRLITTDATGDDFGTTHRTTTSYPASAFQKIVTNPRNFSTTYAYQAFDSPDEQQIIRVLAPERSTTDIVRDVFGKPSRITRSGDGMSVVRRYVYDVHQRLCKTIEPESASTIQAYDLAGNVRWRASGIQAPGELSCDESAAPENRKAIFEYDERNRLKLTTYRDGSPAVTRGYTQDGKLAHIGTNHWAWNYTYNNRRLLTSETYVASGDSYTSGYRYDAHANRAIIDYWGGISIDYSPNALGQPRKVGWFLHNVRWHPNGALAGYDSVNGRNHSVQQTVRGLPSRWIDSGINNDLYSYDANGNVAQILDQQLGAVPRTMQYDGLDRLTVANGPWGTGGFGYDPIDNLRASRVGARVLQHNLDLATNRLASISGSTNLSIAYDANGNVIQRGAQTYSFDIANRMVSATGRASYLYDGHGRRVFVNYADGSVAAHAYSMDGKLLIAGHTVHGTTWYFYLGDRVVAEHNDRSGFSYVHTDALGSPVARTGPTGALLSRAGYEPYGGLASGTLPAGNALGYTGHLSDTQTGLVYMQQRYYDPIAGRFLSIDPVTTSERDGGFFNRYEYAESNPYSYTDPDGRQAVCTGTGISTGCPAGGGIAGHASGFSLGTSDGFQSFVENAQASLRNWYNGSVAAFKSDSIGDTAEKALAGATGPFVVAARVVAARGGTNFFRGAKAAEVPRFIPRPNDFRVDPKTGFVKDTHGVSVFDNALSLSSKGFVPHRVDQSSIPDSLRIIQRGSDPRHFEIVPKPGANLTPQQFINACSSIVCAR